MGGVGGGRTRNSGGGEGGLEIAVPDKAGEPLRAGDVGALANHDEVAFGADDKRFGAAVTRPGGCLRSFSWRNAFDGLGDGSDPIGRSAATAAHHIEPAVLLEFAQHLAHILGGSLKASAS